MTKALFDTISSLFLTLRLYGYTEISEAVLNVLLLYTVNEKSADVPISPRYHKVCKELAGHLTIQSTTINCFGSHYLRTTDYSLVQPNYLFRLPNLDLGVTENSYCLFIYFS